MSPPSSSRLESPAGRPPRSPRPSTRVLRCRRGQYGQSRARASSRSPSRSSRRWVRKRRAAARSAEPSPQQDQRSSPQGSDVLALQKVVRPLPLRVAGEHRCDFTAWALARGRRHVHQSRSTPRIAQIDSSELLGRPRSRLPARPAAHAALTGQQVGKFSTQSAIDPTRCERWNQSSAAGKAGAGGRVGAPFALL